MSLTPDPIARGSSVPELTPKANATVLWLRQLARALRTIRLYHGENAVSAQLRDGVIDALERILADHGALDLRVGPTEILLEGEAVVHPAKHVEGTRDPVQALPFMLYQDGIRRLRILTDAPRREVDAMIQAMSRASKGSSTQDDLVTLLWQCNLTRILIDTVPLEQSIYLSASRPEAEGGGDVRGHAYLLHPGGAEIRGDLGQAIGPQGLHRDTFDDWPLPAERPDALDAWSRQFVAMEASLELFLERCRAEQAEIWSAAAAPFMRRMLELDGSDAMRHALVRSAVSWVAASLQGCAWDEAQESLTLLRELDPQRRIGEEELASAVAGLDHGLVTESLDAAEPEDHARFAAIVVAIGKPAVALATGVMSRSEKMRVRAAACTALTYLCGNEPSLLSLFVEDSRWEIVRNTVFVLGQIGGAEVVPLLRVAASHPEPRVRRQVVQAAGNVPRDLRLPLLTAQLDGRDSQVLAAALNMLTRERSAKVARAILDRIEAPDFEARSEDIQRTLFNALAEVADDSVVGPLEQLLVKGGWFARRTLERVAAARTLRRIGTPRALAVLDAGLRSRVEAVRSACLDAMSSRMAA